METLTQNYAQLHAYSKTLEAVREVVNSTGNSCAWYSDREARYRHDNSRDVTPCIKRVHRVSSARPGGNMATVTEFVEFLDYDFGVIGYG